MPLVAIGTPTFCDTVEAEADGARVIRTGAPTLGWQFTISDLRIQDDLVHRLSGREFDRVRWWLAESVLHKFGLGHYELARDMLAQHGLLVSE